MGNFFKKVGIAAAIGIAFGVLAAFSFAGITRVIDRFFPGKAEVTATIEADSAENGKAGSEIKVQTALTRTHDDDKIDMGGGEVGMSVTELAKNNLPCVVSITNKDVQTVMSMWGDQYWEIPKESRGSGIIIGQTDEELLIATNAHVVNGADTIGAQIEKIKANLPTQESFLAGGGHFVE